MQNFQSSPLLETINIPPLFGKEHNSSVLEVICDPKKGKPFMTYNYQRVLAKKEGS